MKKKEIIKLYNFLITNQLEIMPLEIEPALSIMTYIYIYINSCENTNKDFDVLRKKNFKHEQGKERKFLETIQKKIENMKWLKE